MIKPIYRNFFKVSFFGCLAIVSFLFLVPVPEQAAGSINDKVMHILIFLVLSWLLNQAYPNLSIFPGIAGLLFTYGLIIEVLQGLTDYRSFSWLDLGADTLGIIIYAMAMKLMWSMRINT